MNSKGRAFQRLLCAVSLFVLLFGLSASQVVAGASLEDESSTDAYPALEVPPPSPAEVEENLQVTEEVGERAETPAEIREREETKLAFAEVSPAEASELLVSEFPQQLEDLNSDLARSLSMLDIRRVLDPYGAEIVNPQGETEVLESSVPIQSSVPGAGEQPLDLSLEQTGEGFVPRNALTEVTLPDSSMGSIELPGELAVTDLPGSEDSQARSLGEMNLLYPESDTTTDTLVSPTTNGVEIFEQLRSQESPERFRFGLSLPEGGSLQSREGGSVEVLDADSETTARVPAPTAVDARGAEVPVTMSVDGESLLIEVPHRSLEVTYPVLLDPEFEREENFSPYSISFDSYWPFSFTAEYLGKSSCFASPCWGTGLYAHSKGESFKYPAETYGQFFYTAPGSTGYITKATFSPINGSVHGCESSQPHGWVGLYNEKTSSWSSLKPYSPIEVEGKKFETGEVGKEGTRFAVIGIGTANAESKLKCAHDFEVGGIVLYDTDPEAPTLKSVSGVPTGWLRKDKQARTISATASDPGFGVRTVRMFGVGSSQPTWNAASCTGLAASRCPAEASGTITYETNMFPYEGNVAMTVQAEDGAGRKTGQEYTLKLDGQAPGITLNGGFAEVTKEEGSKEQPQGEADKLSLPVYNLKIKAEDASSSGVKEINVSLDGKALATKSASCSESSCPSSLEWTYPVTLTEMTEGKHTLEVGAVDFVGNEATPSSRKIEFEYIPATGMKEEYVLQHFVLPDGVEYGEGTEYEGPEIAVNVTNGNLVYNERDLQVQAPSGTLEIKRTYNSQQPFARDGQWGHGWSLDQVSEFKPESGEGSPKRATMLRTGAITKAVLLPESKSETTFDSQLHASVSKTGSGDYEVRSETDEETSVFSSGGQLEETRLSSVSPEVTAQPKEAVFPAYVESIGSEGKENGQFSHPADAAVDSKGNLWVVDKENDRLQEFNEAGEFVRSAGSSGSAAGQLKSPSAVTIDSLGRVVVTDTANNRVEVFGEAGEFIKVFGTNVNKTKVEAKGTAAEKNLCTTWSGDVCQAGLGGSAEGEIGEPIGITTTGGQNVFVVERSNSRVEKFGPNGELLAKFGSAGTGSGQLKEPTAIAYSPTGGGYLWVADTGNNRIERFTTSYAFSLAVGKEGTGEVQFKRPAAIEADTEGNVWVGDQENERVQELSKSGDFITKFGGEGQFGFSAPMGIVIDSVGDLWVTDSEQDAVQKWLTGSSLFTASRFGSSGTGNGQFNHPADVAVDSKGNLWALDRGNNRIEKFNEKGEYVTSVGSQGSTGGKLSSPAGLAIDPSGNLWVADTANNRVEEFNEKGEFVITFGREVNKTKVEAKGTEAEKNVCTAASGNVCQAGVTGSAGGQFKAPQGIAATSGGNLWIADTGNSRLEKFGPTGNLINNISSEGSEAGKLKEPGAIAMDPEGSIWVADTGNNRIEEWNSSLAFVQQFGAEGTGNGQFKRPAALDIDSSGNVWVGDQNNERLQSFTASGGYVSQLGGAATQFSFGNPMGIVADGKGSIWVTDSEHNRVQRFPTSQFAEPAATQVPTIDYTYSSGLLTEMELEEPEGEPSMSLTNSSGLTTAVSSEEGSTSYGYSSGNLTSAKDPEGETKYERDASNRLTKVTLPNGTWAKIVYDSSSRVTEVTVKPAGEEEKTTHFWYGLEPRETKVWGGGEPEVIYSISETGSVFKWEYAETPPTIEEPSGGLWANQGKELEKGKDQTLFVYAKSVHEIGSIKVVANGDAVIAETTCEDNSEPSAHNCDEPEPLEWITNPSEHAPGRLDLEIVATDFNGHSAAKSFYVIVPQEEAEGEEAETEPPTFESTRLFREEYGLDRSKSLTQQELNKLVLELLYEWEIGNSAAVAAVDNWGIPMRSAELEEMEYRREYTDRDSEVIPEWASKNASNSYAGFYVDDKAGGIIYVGFTENQHTTVESLKTDSSLLASTQIVEYQTPPKTSLASLESVMAEVSAAIESESKLAQATSSVGVDSEQAVVKVGTTNPASMLSFLEAKLGSNAPISVVYQDADFDAASRYSATGGVVAGSAIFGGNSHDLCTAGYSSRAPDGKNFKYFILTAGHCYPLHELVARETVKGEPIGVGIGYVRRRAVDSTPSVDGEGMLVNPALRSHSVLNGAPLKVEAIRGVQKPYDGQTVCWSGVHSGANHCGEIIAHGDRYVQGVPTGLFIVRGLSVKGDSGAPVWGQKSHKAVGLLKGASNIFGGKCGYTEYGAAKCTRMTFTPLREAGGSPGIVPELNVEILVPR